MYLRIFRLISYEILRAVLRVKKAQDAGARRNTAKSKCKNG